MKKIQILGLALFAVLAFSAVAATTAFAEGELLAGGAKIAAELPIEIKPSATNENLLLEDMNAIGTPDVLCSGILAGNIEIGGKLGLVTKVLTLAGAEKENAVECVDDKSTCSSPVLVTAVNLPWHFEISLTVVGPPMQWVVTLLFEAGKVPGYTVDCNSLLGLVSDTCEAESAGTSATLANEAAGLLAEFSESEAITAPGKCTVGGAKQGLLFGDGIATEPGGAALTVSE